jgi:hypothetical protein
MKKFILILLISLLVLTHAAPVARHGKGKGKGNESKGNSTHEYEAKTITATLSDGSLFVTVLPSPTSKPTGLPVLTVTNSAGALETITLSRGGGRGGAQHNETKGYTVTLADGSVVTGTLPARTETARPTGSRLPVVVTVTNSAGGAETFTLTRPTRGPEGGEGGKGDKKGDKKGGKGKGDKGSKTSASATATATA